jgi:hypothetical protein
MYGWGRGSGVFDGLRENILLFVKKPGGCLTLHMSFFLFFRDRAREIISDFVDDFS